MSIENGRHYRAIPGPTVVPDRVLSAMHRASPNIYAGELLAMMPDIFRDLKAIAGCSAHVAMFMSNGHGGWEAANANMLARGDKVIVAASGRFGLGWAQSLSPMGVAVDYLDFGNKSPVDPARVAEVLAADRQHAIRAVLTTHVDTASSVRNDIVALREAMDATGHPALLAVDAIASLGCDPVLFDQWGIDVLVSASQKGLMMPPGLSFIWFSDRAMAASARADLVTPYWDWKPRASQTEFYKSFAGTAPTHHLFALREALTMMVDEGMENIWHRHHTLSRATWAAFDAWEQGGDIALNVRDISSRAAGVTAAKIGGGGATRLRNWLEDHAGVTLGIGLGMAEPHDAGFHDYLRIAHMGHVNAHMTLGVLAAMEAGMQALGIPHGRGALEAAGAAVAEGTRAAQK